MAGKLTTTKHRLPIPVPGRGKLSDVELEAHVRMVLEKLQDGDNLIRIRRWCMDPVEQGGCGWGDSHTRTVMERARQAMVIVTRETAEETRARLLAIAERGLDEVSTPLFYHGQRVVDPETNKGLYRVDHLARQGYLTFIADLSGLRKTVVVHHDTSKRPAQEMSDDEIMAEIKRLEEAASDRAAPADVVDVRDDAKTEKPKPAR